MTSAMPCANCTAGTHEEPTPLRSSGLPVDLCAQRHRLETLSLLGNSVGRKLVDVGEEVIEQEPHIGRRIPVEPDLEDVLNTAEDAAGHRRRRTVIGVVVEVGVAVARGDLPCAPAPMGRRERLIRLQRGPSGLRSRVRAVLAGDEPADLAIAAVEGEKWGGRRDAALQLALLRTPLLSRA